MVGSGNLVTNEEFVSDFTSVDAASGFEVGISQSNSYNILVEADDNVMEYIEVGKSGDTLVIGANRGFIPRAQSTSLLAREKSHWKNRTTFALFKLKGNAVKDQHRNDRNQS